MTFKLCMNEAAQFSQASVYDYQQGQALSASLAQANAKRSTLARDLKAGAVVFVVVAALASLLMLGGVI